MHGTLVVDKKSTVHKEMVKMMKKSGRIIFLENAPCLDECVDYMRSWLIEMKIKHDCLYNIEKLPFDYLADMLDMADTIIFQTTGSMQIVGQIEEYLLKSKDKKKIINCYINEPIMFFQPDGVIHDIWVINSHSEDMTEWDSCKKLRKGKGYWED